MKEKELISTIESLENYEEVSSALFDLERISPVKAKELAEKILREQLGDVYLQAVAFYVFYSAASSEALVYAKNNFENFPIYVLGAVVEQITEESGVYEENKELQTFVGDLKVFLQSRNKADMESIKESLDWFYETYGK